MKAKFFALAATVLASVVAGKTNAAIVTFNENAAAGFVDLFYTVNAGQEFLNWDLIVAPTAGSVLDPNKTQKSFNAQGGAAPLDTFANTVFSSVGAGAAQYVHTSYNPGQAFPPVPADPEPTAGGTPATLNWSIFDTSTGDGNIQGFFPYHMARVMYTPNSGRGVITAQMFDTAILGVSENFTYSYGIPEPGSIALAGLALVGCFAANRRRS